MKLSLLYLSLSNVASKLEKIETELIKDIKDMEQHKELEPLVDIAKAELDAVHKLMDTIAI